MLEKSKAVTPARILKSEGRQIHWSSGKLGAPEGSRRQGLQRLGEFPPRPLLRIDPIPGSTEAMSTSTPAVPDSNPRTNQPPRPPGGQAPQNAALLGPAHARSRVICPDRWRGSCPSPVETLYGPRNACDHREASR